MKKSIGAQTIVFPTPVFVVGSYDPAGKPNLMTVAWGGICCSEPPCLAISLREATYTYGNISNRGAYTVNVPSASHVREADYVGNYSGRDENKFDAMGLTPVKSDLVDAPYVEEFPLVIECKVIRTVNLGLHTQFIGEILDVKADAEVLVESGNPDIKKVQPLIFAPGDAGYYAVGEFLGQAFSVGKKK